MSEQSRLPAWLTQDLVKLIMGIVLTASGGWLYTTLTEIKADAKQTNASVQRIEVNYTDLNRRVTRVEADIARHDQKLDTYDANINRFWQTYGPKLNPDARPESR